MKKIFLTTLTIFLISIFWCNSMSAQDFSGPKLVLKEQEFNLNEVMEGKVVEHVFQVSNQGDKPLKIINVKPG
jgi:hypothetical protein